jgi:hypothetical protein
MKWGVLLYLLWEKFYRKTCETSYSITLFANRNSRRLAIWALLGTPLSTSIRTCHLESYKVSCDRDSKILPHTKHTALKTFATPQLVIHAAPTATHKTIAGKGNRWRFDGEKSALPVHLVFGEKSTRSTTGLPIASCCQRRNRPGLRSHLCIRY